MKITKLILICLIVLLNASNLHKKTAFSKTDSEKASQRQLQETAGNYIIAHFATSCSYGDNGFASTIPTRTSFVENITVGDQTYAKNVAFEIPAGTDVKINFNTPPESLGGFFNKNGDNNVVNIKSLDFSHFTWSSVTNMTYLFGGCSALESITFGEINKAPVTNVNSMFRGCSNLTSIDVSKLDTSSITDMSYMFSSCSRLKSINITNFNTANVIDMNSMFLGSYSLETIDLDNTKFNTANVIYMGSMFHSCRSLKSIDVSKFNTAKVSSMSSMFVSCNALTSLDVSSFETSLVNDTTDMFSGCYSLVSLDLSNFITTKVAFYKNMFYNCTSLVSLDISNFDFSGLTKDPNDPDAEIEDSYYNMFEQLKNLKYVNLQNVKKGQVDFSATPLNSLANLKVCQSQEDKLITNDGATNICCDFDVTTLDCKPDSPDKEEEEEEKELPDDQEEEEKDKPGDGKDGQEEEEKQGDGKDDQEEEEKDKPGDGKDDQEEEKQSDGKDDQEEEEKDKPDDEKFEPGENEKDIDKPEDEKDTQDEDEKDKPEDEKNQDEDGNEKEKDIDKPEDEKDDKDEDEKDFDKPEGEKDEPEGEKDIPDEGEGDKDKTDDEKDDKDDEEKDKDGENKEQVEPENEKDKDDKTDGEEKKDFDEIEGEKDKDDKEDGKDDKTDDKEGDEDDKEDENDDKTDDKEGEKDDKEDDKTDDKDDDKEGEIEKEIKEDTDDKSTSSDVDISTTIYNTNNTEKETNVPTATSQTDSTDSSTNTTTPTNIPSPSNTPTPTNIPSPSNTPTPTNIPSPSNTPSPTNIPSPSNTPTPTDVPSPTNTPSPSNTPTPTDNQSSSNTPSPTNTPSSSSSTTTTDKTTTSPINPDNPTDAPKIVPRFTIESINQEDCQETGELTLIGKISEPISRTIDFTIPLTYPSGVSLGCTLNGNQLECEVDRIIRGNTIAIDETSIKEYGEDVLIIEEFISEEHVTCSNAFIDKAADKLLVNIAFRQVSHFSKNDQSYSFSFYLITLISEACKKGQTINMKMDVKMNNEKIVKNATCTLQDDVSPNSGGLAQGNFICSVQLTQAEYSITDFEEIQISAENEEINGVSDLDATVANPFKTDKALEEIKRKKANKEDISEYADVIDYYEEEVEIRPIFTIENLYMDGCENTGIFYLEGSFSDGIESMKFDLVLTYPLTEIKCEFNSVNKNEKMNMTCKVYVGFENVENILFEERLIKKKNKEMFIIKRHETDLEEGQTLKCTDFNTVKTQKVKERQKASFSFLQLSKYTFRQSYLTFFMALARKATTSTFTSIIQLTVKITISSRRLLRSLDETQTGVKVDCKLNSTLQTDYAAGYDCTNTDTISGTPSSMELETSEITDIQGIPENANPVKLLYKVDYSDLQNLKGIDSLPTATIKSFNGSTCFTDGQFIVTATLDKNENLESTYYRVELRFAAPESSGTCLVNINGVNVEMICQNAEKFYMSTIYIERQTIQDYEGKELFFIDSYTSETEYACDISLTVVFPNATSIETITDANSDSNDISTDGTSNGKRYYKNNSSGGLSGGVIAAIVISLVVVVGVVTALIILAKKGTLFGSKEINSGPSTDTTASNVKMWGN